MDFILGLPKVDGLQSILMMVDRLTKYAVFCAAPDTCMAERAAKLFFSDMVKYFSLPRDIICDRDTRFTRNFWLQLYNLMGLLLKFSTVNHPQTDG